MIFKQKFKAVGRRGAARRELLNNVLLQIGIGKAGLFMKSHTTHFFKV